MSTVLLILIALVILVGLITIIMSIKNWHWAQMLLLLTIFLVSILNLVFGMEVFRIHRNLRKPLPAKEAQIAELKAKIEAIERGTREEALVAKIFDEAPFSFEAEGRMPSINVWKHRLQMQARERGRVWTNVKPAGPIDPKTGQITALIPAPKPHGLGKDAIVYAFEQIPAAAPPAPPGQGPQYIGEFRVMDVNDAGATLRFVQGLDQRTGARLDNSIRSGRTWKLYETMPMDSHELFAGMSEAQIKQLFPASTVNEYLRQGTAATPNDDEAHRAGYDDKDLRVGADDSAKAVKWLYDRPLRDYAIIFTEMAREKSVKLAEIAGLVEDNNRLKAAQESALKLKAHREQEIAALTVDLSMMKRDRDYIEKLLAAVKEQLDNGRKLVAGLITQNAEESQKLVETQLTQLRAILDSTASAVPASPETVVVP